MAYIEITPIKKDSHLKNAINYINNDDKTDYGRLTDGYKCDFLAAASQFRDTIKKEVIKKGNNVAWHIIQSFSPEDNLTPDKAMEIGKRLMAEIYPNYQYLIAVHTDKQHLHIHIIVCAVDFVTYHKLNSNFGSLAKLQKICNDLCRENGLSVIEKDSKKHKRRLKDNIDKAIEASADWDDFLVRMEELGYEIKPGKRIKFKDGKMENFISSSSISPDYSEMMIQHRINLKRKGKKPLRDVSEKRTVYDDKIRVRSKRSLLKYHIDNSIKISDSFDDFIEVMKSKGFEVKTGKHLAFRDMNGYSEGASKQPRFLRTEGLGVDYTEDIIRYRIEHEKEYEYISSNRIEKRVISSQGSNINGNLSNWINGENLNLKNKCFAWIRNNLSDRLDEGATAYQTFGAFLEFTDEFELKYAETNDKINNCNRKRLELINAVKAIQKYWEMKPIMNGYAKADFSSFTSEDMTNYETNKAKYEDCLRVIQAAKEKHGTLSISDFQKRIRELKETKAAYQKEMAEHKLLKDTLDNIRYNLTISPSMGGQGFNEEAARQEYALYKAEKVKRAERDLLNRKKREDRNKLNSNLFGLD